MHMEQHPARPDPAAGSAAYRDYARQWLGANLPAHMRADSVDYRTPTLQECSEWEASMYRAGLAGMTWPTAYGGLGLTLREHLVVNKEVGALAMPESVSSIGKELAGPIIQTVGTEAQKQQFLPRILTIQDYWCQGFSEPDAGSDLARLRTKAVPEGDTWRINGQKIWTSLAMDANWIFLLVRTNKIAKKQDGISFLLVRMDSPGITVRPIRNIDMGDEFCEVFFDNVRVPKGQMVGDETGHEEIGVVVARLHPQGDRLPRRLARGDLVLRGERDQPGIDVVDAARPGVADQSRDRRDRYADPAGLGRRPDLGLLPRGCLQLQGRHAGEPGHRLLRAACGRHRTREQLRPRSGPDRVRPDHAS